MVTWLTKDCQEGSSRTPDCHSSVSRYSRRSPRRSLGGPKSGLATKTDSGLWCGHWEWTIPRARRDRPGKGQWPPGWELERFTFASPTCNPQPRIYGLQMIGVFPSRVAATVHSLRASAPGPGDTSKEVLSSPGGATAASRGRALLSPRFGLGTGKGKGRLGTSWGLRLGCPVCAHFVHYTSRRNRVPPRRGFRVEVQ